MKRLVIARQPVDGKKKLQANCLSLIQSLPVRQFLLTNLVRCSATGHLYPRIPLDVLTSSLDSVGGFPFTEPGILRYEGPTLFVRGTQSCYLRDDLLPLVKGFFPKFQLRDIDSGHWVISEKPEAFREGKAVFPQDQSALT